ncbi:pyrimidine reductase family protein [Rhodococcus tibetensis]|uniref:Pyrimidine reductase family protein n=1 Tax=Rhodococcus tibetensis TaxID=2965064 RepID=A0ABT1QJB6_9NOCA|nr:pyrimidine reductase family protein [Rhodococcus sp. FXJ9.536]MCQ4122302.1 pyrimidine reductase family protein [Rhodococcus sp. FXJ9.536]
MQRVHIATYLTSDSGSEGTNPGELTAEALRELYAYPMGAPQPWVRANFVCSIDGAVSVGGVSGTLGTPADKRVFDALREAADVVVVGAGTVRAENYGGVQIGAEGRNRRVASGMSAVPPIAVVSARAHLDPGARLFTDTEVAPIVITSSAADPVRVAALAEAGAHVIQTHGREISGAALLASMEELGLRRILCEGGPTLFGQLTAEGLVDELCLTTAPVLVGGNAGRIATSAQAATVSMRPAHVLADTDGTVLTRWVRLPRP